METFPRIVFKLVEMPSYTAFGFSYAFREHRKKGPKPLFS